MDYAALLGAEPGEAVQPTTVEEITAVIARADAEGKSVIPWGGGTAQDYGYLPRRCDILLDLSRLSRIIAHEPGDMTVTVEAGATLAQVQQTLAQHGQFLPLDPPDADKATIGGILATNAFGPSRPGYGTARDWLIGLKVVDAKGRVVKGGGKVVKNVTGYDLPKLHVGALGTLGVIVEATFKLAPLPEASETLSYQFAAPADSTGFLSSVHATLSPTRMILLDAAATPEQAVSAENIVFVTFEGQREVVGSAAARARDRLDAGSSASAPLPPEFASGLTDFPTDASPPVMLRLSGCASGVYERHEGMRQSGCKSVRSLPSAGVTDVAVRADEDAESVTARVIQWAKEHETPIALLKAPASLRRNNEVWWPLPPGFALMRRMKETLDPNGTLNPGRFIGKL